MCNRNIPSPWSDHSNRVALISKKRASVRKFSSICLLLCWIPLTVFEHLIIPATLLPRWVEFAQQVRSDTEGCPRRALKADDCLPPPHHFDKRLRAPALLPNLSDC